MSVRRGFGVAALCAAVAAAGCEPAVRTPHTHGGGMADEYRPALGPVEHRAPGSGVYVLWRWRPAATTGPATQLLAAATRPAAGLRRERAVEVEQVFVRRGQPVGFRRPHGRLVAVAGPTTRPLDAGHYCWHLLPGNPTVEGQTHYTGSSGNGRRDVFVVGVVVTAVFAIDDNDHHAKTGTGTKDALDGNGGD